MQYRPIKEKGKFAKWLDDLDKFSGVYLIRKKACVGFHCQMLYVGESHTGRLKQTLMQHFQHWKGPTAGYHTDAAGVEVATVRCPASQAVELQNALIEEHRPRYNTQGKPMKNNPDEPRDLTPKEESICSFLGVLVVCGAGFIAMLYIVLGLVLPLVIKLTAHSAAASFIK